MTDELPRTGPDAEEIFEEKPKNLVTSRRSPVAGNWEPATKAYYPLPILCPFVAKKRIYR